MLLRLHRAVFGEREGYHAALGASLDDPALLDELRDHTDRPSNHLPGMVWQPFERGFIVRGWYALCRTFPHAEASRGGMVKSFVVFAPLAEMVTTGDFAALMSQLPDDPNIPWPCAHAEIEVTTGEAEAVPLNGVPGMGNLARALVRRIDARLPAVWVGQAGARAAIVALWNAMWPTMRSRFQFDLRFAASGLERQGLTVAVIPDKAAGAWPDTGLLVRPEDPAPADLTPAEAALLGQAEGEPIRTLFQDLDAEPEDFKALRAAALCVASRATLDRAEPEEVYSYLGLLSVLAPAPSQGARLKEEAMRRWVAVESRFVAADVLALRNFRAAAFLRGSTVADELVSRWLRVNLPRLSSADDTAGVLLQALKSEQYCQAWNKHVCDEAVGQLTSHADSMAAVLWQWWERDRQLGRFSAAHLPESKAVEDALVASRPDAISGEVARWVRALAVARGWGLLHAAVCVVSLSPLEAFTAQLELPRTEGVGEGVNLLSASYPPSDTIKAAFASRDDRLMRLAGKLCAQDTALFTAFDWRDPIAQQTLKVALDVAPGVWGQLDNRRTILHDLLGLVERKEYPEAGLLERLSSTEEADLNDFPRREELWDRLVGPTREGFLHATARGWIDTFRADPRAGIIPEGPLAEVIFRVPCLDRLLAIRSPSDFISGLYAFERFPQLDQQTMQDWLYKLTRAGVTGGVDMEDAGRLGTLILRRGWKDAAQILRHAANLRRDLLPALHACMPVFGLFERIAIRLMTYGKSRLDAQEFWRALETLLVETYPRGPGEEGLWQRAGGNDATLDRHGSGRHQWQAALRLLQKGGGGKRFTARKLVAEALKEFPRNEQFVLLDKCARELGV